MMRPHTTPKSSAAIPTRIHPRPTGLVAGWVLDTASVASEWPGLGDRGPLPSPFGSPVTGSPGVSECCSGAPRLPALRPVDRLQ